MPFDPYHEIRGRTINSTAKATLFHRYGDSKPAWFPNTTIKERRTMDNGTVVLKVQEWVYRARLENMQPGLFQEDTPAAPVSTASPEHPDSRVTNFRESIAKVPQHEVRSTGACALADTMLRFMEDDELLNHFDTVVTAMHDKGIDIDKYYKENTDETS